MSGEKNPLDHLRIENLHSRLHKENEKRERREKIRRSRGASRVSVSLFERKATHVVSHLRRTSCAIEARDRKVRVRGISLLIIHAATLPCENTLITERGFLQCFISGYERCRVYLYIPCIFICRTRDVTSVFPEKPLHGSAQ